MLSFARTCALAFALCSLLCAPPAWADPAQPVRIGAQARLKDFYRRHGFVDTGIDYVEDGIDHVQMLRTP